MPSIAIVGAGPAGSTLARLLSIASLPDLKITIFDKDASRSARFAQGGTLDIHTKDGIAAVKAAGLWNEALKYLRCEGEELMFADKNAAVYMHMNDAAVEVEKAERPEIDRENLRDILLDSIEGRDDIELVWGKHLASINEEKKVLRFQDDTNAGPFDLIVGADGGWSRVARVLTETRPSYAGIAGFDAVVTSASAGEQWEWILKMVGKGSYFAFSHGQSWMAQRMGDGSVKLGLWMSDKSESWSQDMVKETGGDDDKLRNIMLAEYSAWDYNMHQIMRVAYRFRPWPLYELPVGHSWTHKQGFTLIGDAAHLMTPFAGEGVNAAMKDALELSQQIINTLRAEKDLDEAVSVYEKESFPRNAAVQEDTMFNKVNMFRSDAPVSTLVGFIDRIARQSGYDFEKGWLAWLPILGLLRTAFTTISIFGTVRRVVKDKMFRP